MPYTTLTLERDGALAILTLNRPDAANGLSPEMGAELIDAANAIAADRGVRAMILTATGRFFSAGGDVKSMAAMGDNAPVGIKRMADDLHRALSTLARMRAPVICAVNGVAAGAGFSMAICGDLVVAAESAAFTMAYSKAGLSADGSSTYYLPRLIGLRKAQELMYTNRMLTSAEALDWGLINSVVADDDLMDAARQMAKQVMAGSPDSNAAMKQLLLTSYANAVETQMELESHGISNCAATPNGQEGIAAFIGKRKAEWVD